MKLFSQISAQLTAPHPLGELVHAGNAFVTQFGESAKFKVHEIVLVIAAGLPVPLWMDVSTSQGLMMMVFCSPSYKHCRRFESSRWQFA